MNINVTGDTQRDSYMIMTQCKHIDQCCDRLKKQLKESDDIRLVLTIQQCLLNVKDCAQSIYNQSGEHS